MSEQNAQPPVVVYSGSRFWSRIGWIGFLITGVLLLQHYVAKENYFNSSHSLEERFHSGEPRGKDKVAIISLSGMIVDGNGYIKRQIDRVRADESVKAVVLRVNSPGGTVYGSDYIYHHLKRLRDEREIPIVVSMGAMAASGGYYVAMSVGEQEDAIFAEPTTTTGSIGVIIPHYDVSGLMEDYNVKNDSIASHPRKQMLAMTKRIPDEHRALLQSQVDNLFERFKQVVHEGRPTLRNDENKLSYSDRDLATGEVFSGAQALEFGLVDRIGFIEDAVERAKELAAVSKRERERMRVIRYRDTQVTLSLPFVVKAEQSSARSELAALLKMTEPRAYFLAPGYLPIPAAYDTK